MGAPWLNIGEILGINAKKYPTTVALKDSHREYTFPQTDRRCKKLANALLQMGLEKGDKVAVFLENCVEICELYFAAAKAGLVVVPINFRLMGPEVKYIVNHSDTKALVVHPEFIPIIEEIKGELKDVEYYIVVSGEHEGYIPYDELLEKGDDVEPDVVVVPEDPWILLYTSGTTGRPKGVLRSHESHVAFYLINAIDFHLTEQEVCLNIMPLCHVNSTFFTFAVTYVGGSVYIHPARSFIPEEVLETIQKEKITFISLVPTHYNLIFNLPPQRAKGYDVSSIKKLLCSSAPAHREMKKRITEFFPGVKLYEGYGSTEAGIVTVLKPNKQLEKLGSIGRESTGCDRVKILDPQGKEVPVGEVGELYSRGPMLFDGYYKDQKRTEETFVDGWFTARDMAREDEEGYYYIVDRKDNMIITGGENVYPTEVEEVVCNHPDVFEAAVIGVPDEKWGEAVMAIVVLKEGSKTTEKEIIDHCRPQIAGFKRPKSVGFISPDEMPKTATGKILHRVLRERFKDGN